MYLMTVSSIIYILRFYSTGVKEVLYSFGINGLLDHTTKAGCQDSSQVRAF